ncbi:SNF2 family N-terminal domain-containing protein [Chytriomyces cf. hyalinus JEL632]|nr:SNF2 family N-terminal domain-containing protein [Chytriomyces cf. hyalinus JEL632]
MTSVTSHSDSDSDSAQDLDLDLDMDSPAPVPVTAAAGSHSNSALNNLLDASSPLSHASMSSSSGSGSSSDSSDGEHDQLQPYCAHSIPAHVGPRKTTAKQQPANTKITLKMPSKPSSSSSSSLSHAPLHKKKAIVYDSDSVQDNLSSSDNEDEIDEFDFDRKQSDIDDDDFTSKKKMKAGSSLVAKSASGKLSKLKKSKPGDRSSTGKHRKEKSTFKTVPYETVTIPMGDKHGGIDKFLSWKISADGEEEVYIKYKNMSYVHCEWIPRSVVEADRMGKTRLQKFLAKPLWESHWSEEDPFNPSFKLVDRVIDDGDRDGELYYLVKWCAQTYDMSTWEPASLVETLDDGKVKEFYARRDVNPAKYQSYENDGTRPSSKEWRKMDESPVYKNDMQLRAYQLEGLNWLLFCWYHNQNSILADEMGLGKTVQSTVFLDYLYTRCNVKGPFLVIAPLSTIGNWERELNRWSDMNVVVYHGRDVARNLIVETEFYYRNQNHDPVANIYKVDVVLTTYEMAMSGMSQLKPINWRCVVLDEAHRLKNKTSKISEVLKQYKMEHRVLLTGTPLQNSLDELWALLNFLQPDQFASERDFQRDFGNLKSAGDVERLQALLKPLMLRRLKEDVEKSIPIKEETIIEVELTTMQKKWYKSILEKNFTWLKQGAEKRNNMPNLINAMMELRKCCIHPFLLNGAEDAIIQEYSADTPEKQFQALIQASGKMVLIDKLLRKLKQGGHKVLIFSQMTRCLDLIQDYLRGQQWGYERIDGSVRGDMRQAAIDRFSAPGCETFVFLLCTRAGGVGINLTAADTVIIFDSDWNPQNDLQAQSRVHRIGQKKSVLIYRLVTRNTYEREMFDKASMKLGLDKAVLQRMDAQSAYGEPETDGKKVSGMSKNEIEDLLKKGAYAAFMDDNASNDFCEEDIDQILTRRTQVIRHDNPAEKSSIFSKATFATSEEMVDINDPQFWDKVAKKAELNIVEVDEVADLIVDSVRARKQVQRFGDQTAILDEAAMSDGDDEQLYMGDAATSGVSKKKDPQQFRFWSQADRLRLERCLMTFGYARWDQFLEICKGRSVYDLKACSQVMIQYALKQNVVDAEVVEDIRMMLAADGIPDIETADMSIPYHGATKRQITEYRSCFFDAPKEQFDYLARKSKNLLQRLQMLYNIREKMNPTPTSKMPPVLGAPLTPWWSDNEDRDLMIGTLKWGYAKYAAIASDPELCFAERLVQLALEKPALALTEPESVDPAAASVSASLAAPAPSLPPLSSELGNGRSGASSPVPQPLDVTAGLKQEIEVRHTFDDIDGEDEGGGNQKPGTATVRLDLLPSASDLGLRVRKVIAAYLRNQILSAKEEEKKRLLEERARAKQEKDDERNKLKERELTKRDRQEFYRTLSSYGVESDLDATGNRTGVRDWSRFKEISQLKKSNEALESYFNQLMALSRKLVVPGVPPMSAEEMDIMTVEKAKKMLKRVDAMVKLREEIIGSPILDQCILSLRNVGKSGLPEWWSSEHDKGYLIGVAKWGLNRADLYVEDDTLPFKAIYEQYLMSREGPEIQPGRIDERFWMKEAAGMKRFYALCQAVLEPPKKRGGGGGSNRKASASAKLDSDLDDLDEGYPVKKSRPSVSRAAAAAPTSSTYAESFPPATAVANEAENFQAKIDEISQLVAGAAAGFKRKRSKKKNGGPDEEEEEPFAYEASAMPLDSSAGIMDDAEVKKKKKSKKKHSHDIAPEAYESTETSDALLAGLMDFAGSAPQEHKKKKKSKKSSHHENGAAEQLMALMGGMMEAGGLADLDTSSSHKKKKSKKSKKHHGEDYNEDSFPGEAADGIPMDTMMAESSSTPEDAVMQDTSVAGQSSEFIV